MGRISHSQRSAADVPHPIAPRKWVSILVAFIVLSVSLAAEWWVSPYALLTTLIDAIGAGVILVPAMLFGHVLLRLLGLQGLPERWVIVLSAALGLGTLCLLVLVAGLAGLLHRGVWIGLLAVMALTGVLSLRRNRAPSDESALIEESSTHRTGSGWTFLWIAAAPFLTLALLAASNPPGMIWQEEGSGYDVLEYHLQLPKEYFQNKTIGYTPHNVYGSFPANMEMLYLLAMVIHADVRDIGTTANMIHLAFAALTVFAAWAIGRDISPLAGIVGGLVVATCTWLEYVSGLAYVENGMLLFGLCALGAALRAFQETGSSVRWWLLAGLVAGFAAGCKYTAIPMIVVPVAVAALFQRLPLRSRIASGVVCGLFALLTASPWLVKNWCFTGNPVFPLANARFEAAPSGWSAEQTVQWDRGHCVDANIDLSSRLLTFWQRIPADHEQRFGPAILSLGLLGLAGRRRDRVDLALGVVLLIQVGVWLFATHLYARFAMPMIVPLALLACRALPGGSGLPRSMILAGTLLVGAGWNFTFAAMRHGRESAAGAPASIFYEGALPGFEYIGEVNRKLPSGARLLLVGDARPFYFHVPVDYFVAFNRNPLLEHIRQGDTDETLKWLQRKHYTHVLIHWSEVRRISKTYGFSPPVGEEELAEAVAGLSAKGLKLSRSFSHPAAAGARYVELYEVPAAEMDRP